MAIYKMNSMDKVARLDKDFDFDGAFSEAMSQDGRVMFQSGNGNGVSYPAGEQVMATFTLGGGVVWSLCLSGDD